MKKLLLLFLIVFSSVQLFSQVDQKAKSILDKVSEKTKSLSKHYCNVRFYYAERQGWNK